MTVQMRRPLLAAAVDFSLLRFPLFGSAKLDGVRCLVVEGKAVSRTLKPLPNRHVQEKFARFADCLEGMDGELIVGDPTAPDVYRTTVSAVMSEDGAPDFSFYVFDQFATDHAYSDRLQLVHELTAAWPGWVRALDQAWLDNKQQVEDLEERLLSQGYEGVILRDPYGRYKQGRSTVREGILLKLKRLQDAEAEIIGFEERLHNGNAATLDERGYTKRSSHRENKIGTDSLGAFVVRGVDGSPFDGIEFCIGIGKAGSLTDADRTKLWQQRDALLGKVVKFAFFPVGVKERPRHPAFLGFRDRIDM